MNENITVETVLALPDDDFEELVSSQLGRDNRNARVWDLLRHENVLPRTQALLELLHHRTTSVLEGKSMELNLFKQQCDRLGAAGDSMWREERRERMASFQGSARFLRLVEEAQLEVNQSVKAVPPARRTLQALQALTAQVVAHEKELGDDPTEADEELWPLLDSTHVVLGTRRLTLRQAHEADWK